MTQKKDNQLKIIVSGFDAQTTEEAAKLVYQQASQSKMKFIGPVPLPTKELKITVPISPHKHKKAQEQFVRKTHRRMFIFQNIFPQDLEKFKNWKFPNTVGIKLKTSF